MVGEHPCELREHEGHVRSRGYRLLCITSLTCGHRKSSRNKIIFDSTLQIRRTLNCFHPDHPTFNIERQESQLQHTPTCKGQARWPAARKVPLPATVAGPPATPSAPNRARDNERRPMNFESRKALSFVRLPPTECRQKREE